MRLTHLGHSCLLVETGDRRLLVDPGSFTPGFEEVRGLDVVLVTHQHLDHVDLDRLPALVAANPGVRLLAEPSTVAGLADAGLDAEPLEPGARHEFGTARVDVVGGEHAIIHPEIPRVGNVGLLLGADGDSTVFHPGDSYGSTPSGVDILALPLSAPWTSVRETIEFVRAVGAPVTFPIHDAVVSAVGRAVYLRVIGSVVGAATELRDLAGAGEVTW
jgi:L-ascorbate metabolism protein UlaG (beta-lactamase superfamily)